MQKVSASKNILNGFYNINVISQINLVEAISLAIFRERMIAINMMERHQSIRLFMARSVNPTLSLKYDISITLKINLFYFSMQTSD